MKAQMVLLAGGVVAGLGLGWLTASIPASQSPRVLEPITVVHGGVEAGHARERLNALGLAPAPVIDTGPAPPDVGVLFRRDLTAIEGRAAGRIAWIVDFTQTYRRRALRVGDIYQDGWRVARIAPQSVELRRRREVRTIDVFALPVSEP